MARNKSRKAGRAGKSVAVNPWLPAVPRKRGRLLKPVLAVPLATLITGAAAADLLPARALTVPAELGQHAVSAKDYGAAVAAGKARVLARFDGKRAYDVAQTGGKSGNGRSSS